MSTLRSPAWEISSTTRLTRLDDVSPAALEPVATTPVEICFPVHDLVIQPEDAKAAGLPADRFDENQIRPAAVLAQRLLALNPAPLTTPREPLERVIGTCHFAVLACALLRHRGFPSRVRIDSEILGKSVLDHPHDLRPGEIAGVRASDDPAAVTSLYTHENLRAPDSLLA